MSPNVSLVGKQANVDTPDASRRLLGACASAGAPLLLYEPQRATLHDAFVRLVGGESATP